MAVKLNSSQIDELKRCFQFRDYDNDGMISTGDVPGVIRSVRGLKPSEAEVRAIQAEVTAQGGSCKLDQLVRLTSQHVTTPPDVGGPAALADMFKEYDKEGRGYASVADMRHVLTSVGEKLSEAEAEDALRMSGAVEGDKVNYVKFVETMLQS